MKERQKKKEKEQQTCDCIKNFIVPFLQDISVFADLPPSNAYNPQISSDLFSECLTHASSSLLDLSTLLYLRVKV